MRRASWLLLIVPITVLLLAILCYFRQDDPASGKDGKTMNAASDTVQQPTHKPSGDKFTNRLAGETSPYLLQHAHNPVHWYPWGAEALRRAKDENKPIFLSIGYSACHWCHVMERESFEDMATAEILNKHFIAIKVDREERPDLDEIYMTSVQMMTGRGGWPLSVFLTPDLKPFFGGTYFPPEDRYGMPSFKKVLQAMADAWREQQDDITQSAERFVGLMKAQTDREPPRAGKLDATIPAHAVDELRPRFDAQWGGFGRAPKFPPSGAIHLLLRQYLRTGDEKLAAMATTTLDRMARGGIHDQLGGGFHRYSVDAQWLVPHFEKMLYDNAILARVYLEAWQATGQESYRRTAATTLDYVLRDMVDSRGAFHSAEDADSEGKEGTFYTWTPDEIKSILGEEDGSLFCEYFGVSKEGNFEGRSILAVLSDPAPLLARHNISAQQWDQRMDAWRPKLLAKRDERVRPGKDDKVLAAWNGMMISAMARGYQVLGAPRYLAAAERAADFVLTEMVRDGVLLRTYRGVGGPDGQGEAKLPGYLEDYAEMATALIDLYEAGFDPRWLAAADRLTRKMVDDFWDDQDGGFFYTSADHRDLLVRTKPFYDGAVPSGNSTAAAVLLRLARLLDNREYSEKAERLLTTASGLLRTESQAHWNLLCALDLYLYPEVEIAIAGRADDPQTRELLDEVHRRFLPNKMLALAAESAADATAIAIPLLQGKTMIAGKTTVYVCEQFVCKQPVHEVEELRIVLDRVPR